MQDMQNIDTLFTDLQNFVKTESVMGTPINVSDKTFVPIVSVTMGYGSGTNKKDPAAVKGGAGVGLGAKVTTNAVIVINKDSVSLLPVNEKGNANNLADNTTMNNLVNKLPEMINNFKQGTQPKNMAQNQQQNQTQASQPNQQKQTK